LSTKGPSGKIGPLSILKRQLVNPYPPAAPMTLNKPSADRRLTSPIVAFFDVDNTVLPGEASEVRFFRWLWRQGMVGWPEVRASLSWLIRHLPATSLHPLRERKLYLAGKPSHVIQPMGESFCRKFLCPLVSPAALHAIETHRKSGHAIVLLTGSLDFLIGPIATCVQAERCYAGQLEQINGVYTGNLIPPLPYGEGKRRLIEQLAREFSLDLSLCYAYGDSPGDLDLLRAVGHPTVINPIRGMADMAKRQNWPIQRWQ